MLPVFQRAESIHEKQAGFSLEYQNIRYTFNINILFSLHTVSYKEIGFTHFYLMVCVQTVKDARSKIKISAALIPQKRFVQREVLLSS